jgi:ribonucleotide reductase beta subunit family protein with ferritin-like domain
MAENNWRSIEHWLTRTVHGNLKGTQHGIDEQFQDVSELVLDDPVLRLVYMIDLASFIQGEKISLEAVANAMTFAPDEECMIFLSTQALDEARHLESFTARLKALDVADRDKVVSQFTSAKVVKLHDLVKEQISKRDFLSVIIALNVILEGLAYPTYKYERKFWEKLDPGMADLVGRAFFDEAQHVGFGLHYVRSMMKNNHQLKNSATRLLNDFKKIVVEIFQEAKANQVRLYGEVTKNHIDLLGDVHIFPNRKIATTPVEEQMLLLQQSIEAQFNKNMRFMGL